MTAKEILDKINTFIPKFYLKDRDEELRYGLSAYRRAA